MMTEDQEWDLLERKLKQRNEMNNPKNIDEAYNLSAHKQAIEDRQGILDSKEPANNKQVGGVHYKIMGIEPWDVIDTWPLHQRIGAYRAGALKYIMRMGSKDASEKEIGKGIHYLEKLLEVIKEQQ